MGRIARSWAMFRASLRVLNARRELALFPLLGGDPSVAGGLEAARRKAGAMLPWALLSATVSVILRNLEDRAGVLGRYAVGLVGIAWSLVTYLVVPILVLENLTVGAALRGSSQ